MWIETPNSCGGGEHEVAVSWKQGSRSGREAAVIISLTLLGQILELKARLVLKPLQRVRR
mgnify:CR=1 FL=1